MEGAKASLGRKLFVALAFAGVLLLVALTWVSVSGAQRAADLVVEARAAQAFAVAQAVLERNERELIAVARELAGSPAVRAAVQGKDLDGARDDFAAAQLRSPAILVLLADAQGRTIVSANGRSEGIASAAFAAAVADLDTVAWLGDSPWLLVGSTVRDAGGTRRGLIVVGRALDAAFVARLAESAGLPITLRFAGKVVGPETVPDSAVRGNALGAGASADLEVLAHVPLVEQRSFLQRELGTIGAVALVTIVLFLLLAAALSRQYTRATRSALAMRHQALHDALTDLPNRVLLYDRLEQAIAWSRRHDTMFALLLLDLDQFKDINDTFGHATGDKLLQEIGPRLREVVRESDTVARLGGDEFALVLPETDRENAAVAAGRVVQALERPLTVEGHPLHVGASVGVAVFPQHGDTSGELLRRADIAMYAAKSSGVRYTLYDEKDDRETLKRLSLVSELRRALQQGILVLHYQPEVDLASGKVVRVEALARWPHASRGLIPPSEFIPAAERSGLINPLTEWVVSTVLQQAREWRRKGIAVPVAVNLSARSLFDAEFTGRLAHLLKDHGADASWLTFELTESAVMSDAAHGAAMLHGLRDMGIRLAIDDFGTGYSSLAYLQRLPVHDIKIDRSFVGTMLRDPGSASIVRATIELAHSLGFQLVAEGVESEEIADRLSELGCDAIQGYHVAKPMPAAELEQWILSRQGRKASRARVAALETAAAD